MGKAEQIYNDFKYVYESSLGHFKQDRLKKEFDDFVKVFCKNPLELEPDEKNSFIKNTIPNIVEKIMKYEKLNSDKEDLFLHLIQESQRFILYCFESKELRTLKILVSSFDPKNKFYQKREEKLTNLVIFYLKRNDIQQIAQLLSQEGTHITEYILFYDFLSYIIQSYDNDDIKEIGINSSFLLIELIKSNTRNIFTMDAFQSYMNFCRISKSFTEEDAELCKTLLQQDDQQMSIEIINMATEQGKGYKSMLKEYILNNNIDDYVITKTEECLHRILMTVPTIELHNRLSNLYGKQQEVFSDTINKQISTNDEYATNFVLEALKDNNLKTLEDFRNCMGLLSYKWPHQCIEIIFDSMKDKTEDEQEILATVLSEFIKTEQTLEIRKCVYELIESMIINNNDSTTFFIILKDLISTSKWCSETPKDFLERYSKFIFSEKHCKIILEIANIYISKFNKKLTPKFVSNIIKKYKQDSANFFEELTLGKSIIQVFEEESINIITKFARELKIEDYTQQFCYLIGDIIKEGDISEFPPHDFDLLIEVFQNTKDNKVFQASKEKLFEISDLYPDKKTIIEILMDLFDANKDNDIVLSRILQLIIRNIRNNGNQGYNRTQIGEYKGPTPDSEKIAVFYNYEGKEKDLTIEKSETTQNVFDKIARSINSRYITIEYKEQNILSVKNVEELKIENGEYLNIKNGKFVSNQSTIEKCKLTVKKGSFKSNFDFEKSMPIEAAFTKICSKFRVNKNEVYIKSFSNYTTVGDIKETNLELEEISKLEDISITKHLLDLLKDKSMKESSKLANELLSILPPDKSIMNQLKDIDKFVSDINKYTPEELNYYIEVLFKQYQPEQRIDFIKKAGKGLIDIYIEQGLPESLLEKLIYSKNDLLEYKKDSYIPKMFSEFTTTSLHVLYRAKISLKDEFNNYIPSNEEICNFIESKEDSLLLDFFKLLPDEKIAEVIEICNENHEKSKYSHAYVLIAEKNKEKMLKDIALFTDYVHGDDLLKLIEIIKSCKDGNKEYPKLYPIIFRESGKSQKAVIDLYKSNKLSKEEINLANEAISINEDGWNIKDDMCSLSETNVVGLKNLGSTCYMNSILQQVFFMDSIRESILSREFDKSNLIELQKLFNELLHSAIKYADTRELCNCINFPGKSPIQVNIQHDACEFFHYLINELPDKVSKPIRGKMIDIYEYDDKKIRKEQPFISIQVKVDGFDCLEDSIKEFLEKKELSGDNKYITEDGRRVNATVTSKIVKLPSIIAFQLMRFSYDLKSYRKIRISSRFDFPKELDMKNLVENSESKIYNLVGVVVHQGTAEGGHYRSLIRLDNKWVLCDDINTTFADKDFDKLTVGGHEECGPCAYVLLYSESTPKKLGERYFDIEHEKRTAIFTKEFADFILSSGDKKLIINYLFNVFFHTDISEYMSRVENIIKDLPSDLIKQHIIENSDKVLNILINCPNSQHINIVEQMISSIDNDNKKDIFDFMEGVFMSINPDFFLKVNNLSKFVYYYIKSDKSFAEMAEQRNWTKKIMELLTNILQERNDKYLESVEIKYLLKILLKFNEKPSISFLEDKIRSSDGNYLFCKFEPTNIKEPTISRDSSQTKDDWYVVDNSDEESSSVDDGNETNEDSDKPNKPEKEEVNITQKKTKKTKKEKDNSKEKAEHYIHKLIKEKGVIKASKVVKEQIENEPGSICVKAPEYTTFPLLTDKHKEVRSSILTAVDSIYSEYPEDWYKSLIRYFTENIENLKTMHKEKIKSEDDFYLVEIINFMKNVINECDLFSDEKTFEDMKKITKALSHTVIDYNRLAMFEVLIHFDPEIAGSFVAKEMGKFMSSDTFDTYFDDNNSLYFKVVELIVEAITKYKEEALIYLEEEETIDIVLDILVNKMNDKLKLFNSLVEELKKYKKKKTVKKFAEKFLNIYKPRRLVRKMHRQTCIMCSIAKSNKQNKEIIELISNNFKEDPTTYIDDMVELSSLNDFELDMGSKAIAQLLLSKDDTEFGTKLISLVTEQENRTEVVKRIIKASEISNTLNACIFVIMLSEDMKEEKHQKFIRRNAEEFDKSSMKKFMSYLKEKSKEHKAKVAAAILVDILIYRKDDKSKSDLETLLSNHNTKNELTKYFKYKLKQELDESEKRKVHRALKKFTTSNKMDISKFLDE